MSTVKTMSVKYIISQSLGDPSEWKVFRQTTLLNIINKELVSTCESREEAEELVRELEKEQL